jgi:monomeric isocitrate dehydrogenase
MLSCVPLTAGGGLFEIGAGGSAPSVTRRRGTLAIGHHCFDGIS